LIIGKLNPIVVPRIWVFKHEGALYKGRLLPLFQLAARFHACMLSSVGSLHCCNGRIQISQKETGAKSVAMATT